MILQSKCQNAKGKKSRNWKKNHEVFLILLAQTLHIITQVHFLSTCTWWVVCFLFVSFDMIGTHKSGMACDLATGLNVYYFFAQCSQNEKIVQKQVCMLQYYQFVPDEKLHLNYWYNCWKLYFWVFGAHYVLTCRAAPTEYSVIMRSLPTYLSYFILMD